MILEIVQYGDPVLRKKCRKVGEVTAELRELVKNMEATMHDAEGIGLAAPQVGVDIALAIVDVSHDADAASYLRVNGEDVSLESLMPLVFLNPSLEFGKKKELQTEGCLSIEDLRAKVNRPVDVKATLETLEGETIVLECDGLLARAIQHETDHLNGVLFTDRLTTVAKSSAQRKLKRLVNTRRY